MEFCSWITFAPGLEEIPNPITYLKMFSDRVRIGTLTENCASVHKCTMEGYLWYMAHIFYGVGNNNPHLYDQEKINFSLNSKLWAYTRANAPHPDFMQPITIYLPHEWWTHLRDVNRNQCAIYDLLYVILFLCRKGEYWKGGNVTSSHPLSIGDVQFFIVSRNLCATDSLISALFRTTLVTPKFNNKKLSTGGVDWPWPLWPCHAWALCRALSYVEYLQSPPPPPPPTH